MDYLFINANYKKDIELDKATLDYCKKYKTLALYSSVQFSGKLKTIISQLKKSYIKVITSKPKRANSNYQLLGCDISYADLNLETESDAFLYIGDGLFHPLTLIYAQKKEVIQFNPFTKQHNILTLKDIEKILKKNKANLTKFLHSEIIGIIISIKPGQQQFIKSKELIKKFPNKQFYFFIDNNIYLNNLENFSFIQCWVNTACPRIALDDIQDFNIPIINLNDVLK